MSDFIFYFNSPKKFPTGAIFWLNKYIFNIEDA